MSPAVLLVVMSTILVILSIWAAYEKWRDWRTDKQMKRGFEYLKRHKLYAQPDKWVTWKGFDDGR